MLTCRALPTRSKTLKASSQSGLKSRCKLTRVRFRAPPQRQRKSRLRGWVCSSAAGGTCPLPGRNLGDRDQRETMMNWNAGHSRSQIRARWVSFGKSKIPSLSKSRGSLSNQTHQSTHNVDTQLNLLTQSLHCSISNANSEL